MFIVKQLLDDGTIRTILGRYNSAGIKEYEYDEPKDFPRRRIVARIELNCDDNPEGHAVAVQALQNLTADFDRCVGLLNLKM